MDAKKAIEEGRSYLLVMTDRRMKPDEADAKKMQKIEKFIEKTERKKPSRLDNDASRSA